MTRILCWNIDNFEIRKIDNVDITPFAYAVTHSEAATGRLGYILESFGALLPITNRPAIPDIFIVVEVNLGNGVFDGPGRIASPQARDGVNLLLDSIRAHTHNDNWMLVPPLQTGRFEAVAVYYDSTNYVFTGPWIWPGGNGPAQDPAVAVDPAGLMQPYNDYAGTLPAREVPAGLTNAGRPEARLAAATGFKRPGPVSVEVVYADNERRPYWVKLGQLVDGAVTRELSLFIVHGPASNVEAPAYIAKLADAVEITVAPEPNEVRLVLGDFNQPLLTSAGTPHPIVPTGAYRPLTDIGYQMGITSPGTNHNPMDGTSYQGYFATHMRTVAASSYWYMGASADFYPGYGYTSGAGSSLDNVLARFGEQGGVPCGVLQHVTMLNGVVGTPYVDNGPDPTPLGYYKFPLRMGTRIEYIHQPMRLRQGPVNPNPPPPRLDPRYASFRQWGNYARIRTTSDHMPLLFDV